MKDVEILEYSIEEPFGVEGEECYERLSWILLPRSLEKSKMEHFLQNTHTIFAIFVHYKKQKERYTIIVLRNIFFDMN